VLTITFILFFFDWLNILVKRFVSIHLSYFMACTTDVDLLIVYICQLDANGHSIVIVLGNGSVWTKGSSTEDAVW
jgi:hypothetical protein